MGKPTPQLLAIAVALSIALGGCGRQHPADLPSASAQSRPATEPSLTGMFVTTDQDGSIVGIEVPTGKRHIIRPAPARKENDPAQDAVWAVAGPGSTGLIAFLEEHDDFYELEVIASTGGPERVVFRHPGNAIWKNAVGNHLGLSNAGGHVAFVGQMHGVQMPQAYLQEGPLEVCSIASTAVAAHGMVLDQGFAWLGDNKHLACVRLVSRTNLPAAGQPADHFGQFFEKWERVPAICIVDVENGDERVLCAGITPVVSTDGQTILVADFPTAEGTHWRRVNLKTGACAQVPLMLYRSYVAVGLDDASLYLELPGPGESAGKTKSYSPLRGPQSLLLLKAGKLGGAGGEMIGDDVDPRASFSFGSAAP